MAWINFWYIGLLFFLIFSSFITSVVKSKVFINIFILFLMLFSGLRYGVGIDYFVYESMVNEYLNLSYIEPLSRLLLLVARHFETPVIFFLSTSVIYVGSIMVGLRRFKSYGVFTVFIFTLFTLSFLTSMGYIRQFVATGILFIAFSFLFEKRYKYFFLFVSIATLFHYSAILYMLFYFIGRLLRKRWNNFIYLIAVSISLVSTKLVTFIIEKIGFYAHYFEKFEDGSKPGMKIYLSLLLVTLLCLLIERFFIRKEKKGEMFFYAQNMVIAGLCLYSMFLPFGEHLSRISYHLVPFYYIWLYLIFKGISNKSIKELYLFIVVVICLFYYFSTLYFAQFSSRGDFLNNYELAI